MTSQEPSNPISADAEILDTEVIVVAQPSPVFVDSTGRRRRVLRRVAYGFGVFVDHRLSGEVNLNHVVRGAMQSGVIGYWVDEARAGRGLIAESVVVVCAFAFEQLDLHRIEICIRPENAPSLRVVEKLGFRYEGLRRRYIHINGDWRDHFCFALVAEEVREGVLDRWVHGAVPPGAGSVPLSARDEAAMPLPTRPR